MGLDAGDTADAGQFDRVWAQMVRRFVYGAPEGMGRVVFVGHNKAFDE